ncbi:hypothetical protein LYSHEL_28470 [Lysobacter helvus]|uniref:Uncharacterized protein n=2 Tax=Lysobacteraceae TaxID=32033 RepID=A0ABN6FWS3_9GAMM|nr:MULTISPECIES: hypothetical protein [Lysobacter]BCT93820.1 hypothetical protein LYSCAS_28440 [Lysobacter caseinilyticus]BCT96976.1 hypothetical protein LYSHEL_28470 [Lysobacter helvus]
MSTKPTSEEAMNFMADAVLYQRIDLTGPWEGWKIRGQYLVSPNRERIPVRELVGLLIHYRAKFGHHRSKPKALTVTEPSNVIPFAAAAVERLRGRPVTRETKAALSIAGEGAQCSP